MTIAEHIDDSIITIELTGRLTSDTLEPFQLAVARRLREGSFGFVIDLQGVDYIDSEGLGSLIQAYTSCKKRGAPIVFVHVFGRNLQLLKVTKLLTVFEIYANAIEARRSFANIPPAPVTAIESASPG
jgi:anti-sigma B factor antagonist